MADTHRFRFAAGVLFILAAASAQAGDLNLKDGRVLKDATIKSETPRNVIVLYADGMTSVDKRLLPDDLRKLYPVAPGAIDREAEPRPTAEAAAVRRAELARIAKKNEEKKEVGPAAPRRMTETEMRRWVRNDAVNLAELKFDQQEQNTSDFKMCRVQIDSLRPVEGQDNLWVVSGRATMYRKAYYSITRDTSAIGDAEWRKRHNGTIYEQPDFAPAESKVFEGRYTYNGDGTSTLEITDQ
jgi:hypothetical protein